jgi:hypothetical protein
MTYIIFARDRKTQEPYNHEAETRHGVWHWLHVEGMVKKVTIIRVEDTEIGSGNTNSIVIGVDWYHEGDVLRWIQTEEQAVPAPPVIPTPADVIAPYVSIRERTKAWLNNNRNHLAWTLKQALEDYSRKYRGGDVHITIDAWRFLKNLPDKREYDEFRAFEELLPILREIAGITWRVESSTSPRYVFIFTPVTAAKGADIRKLLPEKDVDWLDEMARDPRNSDSWDDFSHWENPHE